MIESLLEARKAYEAANAAVQQLRPHLHIIRQNAEKGESSVSVSFNPADNFVHIGVYSVIRDREDTVRVGLDNIDALIEALAILRTGNVLDIPAGWSLETLRS